ncbi:MAG: 16S rRNA (guanine(527)-N(7))-methyltransferase RsmG [Roseitalea sp.]|jgi:16S rRNA (guanine527-N7)-methyltransferase|nr:16S rRNA (guanine(527)-N(7))-methyltransferase RsmG [Roseitalea sp.]MBO6720893.1 16S rRNA (guanine(527)-N(7))-methyltransferase RsmG [Roseitalea sp.]MBO6743198.1 16S rRNA (guanine(527)-N(7))-methyltransferase RsmG [Roseitalea sp.]
MNDLGPARAALSFDRDGSNVSRETLRRMAQFADLFDAWSKRINLVASSTGDDFWTRHVADSAQLLRLKPDARHWADLGSGGGFPGMVIAILLSETEGAHVDLIESNRKKAAFLQTVRAACAPCASVHPARIEDAVLRLEAPQVVTARALAPLDDLLSLVTPWLAAGTTCLFHKGRGYADEVADSRAHWHFDLIVHESVAAPDSVILEISDVRRAPNSH